MIGQKRIGRPSALPIIQLHAPCVAGMPQIADLCAPLQIARGIICLVVVYVIYDRVVVRIFDKGRRYEPMDPELRPWPA